MTTEITDVPSASHYAITVDGVPAGVAEYHLRGEKVVFTHTLIEPAFEGKGVGSALAKAALEDVRARGLRVVPLCPFIHAYIERHPEFADLVDPT